MHQSLQLDHEKYGGAHPLFKPYTSCAYKRVCVCASDTNRPCVILPFPSISFFSTRVIYLGSQRLCCVLSLFFVELEALHFRKLETEGFPAIPRNPDFHGIRSNSVGARLLGLSCARWRHVSSLARFFFFF